MFTNTKDVIVLEITVTLDIEKEKNGHYFTIRQRGFLVTVFLFISDRKRIFFNSRSKFLSNSLIIQKKSVVLSLAITVAYFVTYCLSDLENAKQFNDYQLLRILPYIELTLN